MVEQKKASERSSIPGFLLTNTLKKFTAAKTSVRWEERGVGGTVLPPTSTLAEAG